MFIILLSLVQECAGELKVRNDHLVGELEQLRVGCVLECMSMCMYQHVNRTVGSFRGGCHTAMDYSHDTCYIVVCI